MKNKTFQDKKTVIIDICVLICVGFLILIPYFFMLNYEGDDTVFHSRCIEVMSRYSFVDMIKGLYTGDGILPGMIIDNVLGKMGYGAGIFYPPIAHIAPVLIYKLFSFTGISLMLCYRLSLVIAMILSGLFMYMLCKMIRRFTVGDEKEIETKLYPVLNPEMAAAVIYMTAPYHLSDQMTRDAMAECWIFVFIPVLFMSLLYLMKDNYAKSVLTFVIACTGFIHSHMVMTLYMAIFFGLALIISFNRVFFIKADSESKKNIFAYKRLIAIASGMIFTCLLSLPFFVRLIINKGAASYYVFDGNMSSPEVLNKNRLMISGFFLGMGEISVLSNLVVLVVVIAAVILYIIPVKDELLVKLKECLRSSDERNVLFKSGILFFILSSILCSELINWNYVPHFMQLIQFPWRMITFQIFGMALISYIFLTSYSSFEIKSGKKGSTKKYFADIYKFIFIILIACFAYTLVEQIYYYRVLRDTDYNNYQVKDVADYPDYLPMNAVGKYPPKIDTETVTAKWDKEVDAGMNIPGMIEERLSFPAELSDINTIIFETKIDEKESNGKILAAEIPRLYYQGYTITVEDAATGNGNAEKIEYYETENGLIGIKVPEGSRVSVRFTGTHAEIVANYVSLVTLIIFIISICLASSFLRKNTDKSVVDEVAEE